MSTPIDSKMSVGYARVVEHAKKTLTIDELTERTGFDRRTIAYYVQEGLLPKVGRRGRLTRYPRFIADRLLFIKHLREAEESGERAMPMTLAEIRDVFERTPPELIADIAAGNAPVTAVDQAPPTIDSVLKRVLPPELAEQMSSLRARTLDGLAPRELKMDLMLEETDEPDLFVPGKAPDSMAVEEPIAQYSTDPPAYGKRQASRLPTEDEYSAQPCASGPPPILEDELSELLTLLSRLAGRMPPDRDGTEHWTDVAITPGFKLAARDLDERGGRVLRKLAKLLGRKID